MNTTCPACGEQTRLSYHRQIATEPHGESHTDEWYQCPRCGARIGVEEVEAHS